VKIKAEIELTGGAEKRLEDFFEAECVDREKWQKKALSYGVEALLKNWESRERLKAGPGAPAGGGSVRQDSGGNAENGGSADDFDNWQRRKIGEESGEILETADPDGRPFFNSREIEIERSVFNASTGAAAAKKQYLRLKNELETRKKKWQAT